MDPIAHTLVGAALAQTGLGRRTAYGTAALVIGANLPDIDALAMLVGRDTALYFRRGWTHGILAVVILPWVLTGLIATYEKWTKRASRGSGPPFRMGATLGLCYLAIGTHPSLDWLNTYGMRWLMPFEGRWFYGDSVFIVDPWIWILLGGSAFLFYSRKWGSLFGWCLLAGAEAALLLSVVQGLVAAKVMWLAVLVVIAVMRFRGVGYDETAARRIALGALSLTVIYIGTMVATAQYARDLVAKELRAEGIDVVRLMVAPVPVTPFVRDVVVQTPDVYRFGILTLVPRVSLDLAADSIPVLPSTPVVEMATKSEAVRGFMNWARFPFAEVEEHDEQYDVYLFDARYQRLGGRGFGATRVVVPKTAVREGS